MIAEWSRSVQMHIAYWNFRKYTGVCVSHIALIAPDETVLSLTTFPCTHVSATFPLSTVFPLRVTLFPLFWIFSRMIEFPAFPES